MSQRPRRRSRVDQRSQTRERVLTLLYEADTKNIDGIAVVEALVDPLDATIQAFMRGISEHRDVIDAMITESAEGWAIERMPCLDRNILRLATFELMHRGEVPQAVILDEAVELAKVFSTDDSGRYVNGVLATIAKKVRPQT